MRCKIAYLLAPGLLFLAPGCAPEMVVGDRDGGTITASRGTDPFAAADSYCKKVGRAAIIGSYEPNSGKLTFDCVAP